MTASKDRSCQCTQGSTCFQVHKYFEEVDGAFDTRMWSHLATCEACREVYERYVVAERFLYPEAPQLTPAAIDRVEAAVLARVQSSKEPSVMKHGWWGHWRAWGLRWLYGVGTASVAGAVIAAMFAVVSPSPEVHTLQSRGGDAPGVRSEKTLQGFRVLAIEAGGVHAPSIRELNNDATISIYDRLAFLITIQGSDVVRIIAHSNGKALVVQTATVGGGINLRTGPSVSLPAAWQGRKVRLSAVAATAESVAKPIFLGIEASK